MRTPSSSEEAGDLAKVTQQVNSRVTARIQSTKACSFWAPVPTKGSGEMPSKSLQTINVRKGLEKRKPSHTVGGKAN